MLWEEWKRWSLHPNISLFEYDGDDDITRKTATNRAKQANPTWNL